MMMIAVALAFTPPSVRHVRTTTIAMAATPKSFEDALADAPTLCAALQAGEAPEGLGQFVASSAGARGFFVHYLTGDEWTCADKEEVPAARRYLMGTRGAVVSIRREEDLRRRRVSKGCHLLSRSRIY